MLFTFTRDRQEPPGGLFLADWIVSAANPIRGRHLQTVNNRICFYLFNLLFKSVSLVSASNDRSGKRDMLDISKETHRDSKAVTGKRGKEGR